MAWDVNHQDQQSTILFDRDQNGKPFKNPVDFNQMAHQKLEALSLVLQSNILITETNRQ